VNTVMNLLILLPVAILVGCIQRIQPAKPALDTKIYEVTDAVGDGVHDDASAIQSALDACYRGGGGIVELDPPPRTYLIETPLYGYDTCGITIRKGRGKGWNKGTSIFSLP
jgi:hypothetical protein